VPRVSSFSLIFDTLIYLFRLNFACEPQGCPGSHLAETLTFSNNTNYSSTNSIRAVVLSRPFVVRDLPISVFVNVLGDTLEIMGLVEIGWPVFVSREFPRSSDYFLCTVGLPA
jgi:hypothetical protein